MTLISISDGCKTLLNTIYTERQDKMSVQDKM